MKKNILFDCERMRYPNTGLNSFCKHLGKELLKLKNQQESILLYGPERINNIFGIDNNYLSHKLFHKIIFPSTKNINVWHATHQGTDYFPFNKKVKIVLTIHDINFMHEHSKSIKKQERYLDKLKSKIEKADHIVFVSEFTKNDVNQYISLESKNISVIYNGCDLDFIPQIITPINAPKESFIFNLGLVTPKKNVHVLPPLLCNNDFKLVIGGQIQSKEYMNFILAEAAKFGVLDRVIFTGPLSENDKQWYYTNCAAFAFPSIAEGFGLPPLEAMKFGKPVFLSNYTSLPELGGKNAFYFKNFNPELMQYDLFNGLHEFENNQMSDSIKLHAEQFSWKKAAGKYLDVYRNYF